MALPWGRAVAPSIQGPGARQKGRDWVKWGLFGAKVGSERRTYELLSLRPTNPRGPSGAQVEASCTQMSPKCSPKLPKCSTRFPQGSQEGCFLLPKGASESIFGCVQGKRPIYCKHRFCLRIQFTWSPKGKYQLHEQGSWRNSLTMLIGRQSEWPMSPKWSQHAIWDSGSRHQIPHGGKLARRCPIGV